MRWIQEKGDWWWKEASESELEVDEGKGWGGQKVIGGRKG